MAGYRTVPAMFYYRTRESAEKTAVMHKQNGQWIPRTWKQLETEVRETARGTSDWIDAGDMVCILSENRPEWWIADLAILSLAGASTPIFAASPPKDIAYILRDCGARLLFVSSAAQLDKVRALKQAGQAGQLERVVVFDQVQAGEDWVHTLEEVRRRNSDAGDPVGTRLQGLGEEDLAMLIYTSGTTGEPKGVMLTHKNMVTNIIGAKGVFDQFGLDERLCLSFLPLAHVFERLIGFYVAIAVESTVAFAEGAQQLVDNMGEVRPTWLVSVPRIYEKVYARVMHDAGSGFKRKLVLWALKIGELRSGYMHGGQPIPPWVRLRYAVAHKLVFSRLHARLGGRLKCGVSSSAPLAPEILEFLHAVDLNVVEAYALTEAAALTCNPPGSIRIGSVGTPLPNVEIRIEPDPERESQDGEILARGPGIMKGYFNKPEATAAVFDEDGWFRTGDIGHLDRDGYLFITDRKKELLKTAGGKYVAPQPIENRLKLHPLIEQAVVIGDRRKYCVALIVTSFEGLKAKIDKSLLEDRAAQNSDAQVRSLIQVAVDEVNRDLGDWEQIKYFSLLPAELTQASGELTHSLKIKRRVVEENYRAMIDAMYPSD